ncbi:MAG: hypothetical protein AAFN42_17385 [Cyanobacteria bacterium J06554_1]
MAKNKSSKRLSWQLCKPVIASALAVSGVFNLVGIVLAEGTAAGTQITNTATATYRDPDGTPQTSTSNTVVVEVAEIAGITVVNTSATEVTPDADPPGPGESLEFIFDITNVGNDETDISLPAVANFTGPVDSVTSIELIDPITGVRTPINSRTDFENLAPNSTVQVAVTVLVSTSAQNDDIVTVQYGDTPGDGQNQPYDSSGGSVFTDDNDATDVANGTQTPAEAGPDAPANGEREASDTGELTIGEADLQQPFVTLLKQLTNHDAGATGDPVDDTLTYALEFNVGNTDLNGDVAADLRPILIEVDGADARHVLISDALPARTSIQTHTSADGTWTPVYTESPIGTNPLNAQWQTGAPTAATTRVGFIKDADEIVAQGTTVTGFQITVVADGYTDPTESPITIANIAQIFGSGVEDDPLTPDDETLSFPVMDESGDQTPSNYDPATETYSNFNPDVIDTSAPDEVHSGFAPDDGYIDDPSDLINTGVSDTVTSNDPTDPENLATGTLDPSDDNPGAPDNPDNGGGEAVVVQLVADPVSELLNGPDGAPDAVGPTGTDDDFTNKSAPFSDGDPPVVAFTNTVKNDSSDDGWVTLTPIAPDNTGDLPINTTATIIAPDGTRTLFTYDGAGTWDRTSGPEVVVEIRADGSTDGPDEFDYGVEVDLPGAGVVEQDSYPVPILAQFDSVADGQNQVYVADNITIDRVYTGFLELVKTAQVVRGDGPEVSGNPAPGNHIRYRVTYRNISETEVAPMQGNVLLTASDLAILEDGTELACPNVNLITDPVTGDVTGGPNNWAVDNDNGDGDNNFGTDLDTRHVPSSVDMTNLDAGSTGSVVFYSGGEVCDGNGDPAFNPDTATPSTEISGTTYNTDSTKYVFSIDGDIEPLETGYVEFERRIN